MDFKQLEHELKQLVEKHKKLLPNKYDIPTDENTFIERLMYIDKNELFKNELNEINERFINEYGLNNISEKEAFTYMVNFHKRNYQNGINSQPDIDSYQLRFGNQNH